MASQYNSPGGQNSDFLSQQSQRPEHLPTGGEVPRADKLGVPESPRHGQLIGSGMNLPGSPRYDTGPHRGTYDLAFTPGAMRQEHVDEQDNIHFLSTPDDFAAMSDTYVRLSQAKCVLLGSVAAGKTSLLNALRYGEPRLAPAGPDGRTIGIEVHSVAVRPDTKLWFYDFGGHDTYHFSQQLFLTSRAIYLIAVDVSIYDKVKVEKTLRHWYTILTSRLVSPVICLLATHIDECHDKKEMYQNCLEMDNMLKHMDERRKQKLEFEMAALKDEITGDPDPDVRRFQPRTLRQPLERLNLLLSNRPRIFHKVCCISSKTLEGIDQFKNDLVSIVADNESLFPQKDVPKSWIALADAIVSKKEDVPFVTINEFIEMAQEFSVVGDYVQKALIYLQSVGLVLHYQDYRQNSELSKYVFVNPNLLLAIFGLVFNHNYFMDETRFVWKHKSILRLPHYDFVHLRKNLKERGVIGEKLLKCFWDAMGISDEVYQAIVPLLEKFDLCYEIRLKPGEAVVEGRHFLFPYLLNKRKPPEIKFMWSDDLLDHFMQCGVELNFTTQSLPFGFLEKVLVRAHTYVDHCLSWKQGMVAFCDEGQDLVRIEAGIDNQGNANLTISARVRVGRKSMARHIILLLVAVTNRVLLHHYPGVVAYWYCLCSHCIFKMLTQKYSEVSVDRFPADNIVYTAPGDPLQIRCNNCKGGDTLSIEQVFPVSSEDVNNLKRLMSEPCCRAIKASEPALLKHMNYRDVMNALLRKNLLTIKQAEAIGSKANHEERSRKLLSCLPDSDQKAFEVLCHELKQTEETAWLADELKVRAAGGNKKSQEEASAGSGILRMTGWRGSQSSQGSQGASSINSGSTWSSYSQSTYGSTGSYIRRPYGSYIQRESAQDYSKRPRVNYSIRSQNEHSTLSQMPVQVSSTAVPSTPPTGTSRTQYETKHSTSIPETKETKVPSHPQQEGKTELIQTTTVLEQHSRYPVHPRNDLRVSKDQNIRPNEDIHRERREVQQTRKDIGTDSPPGVNSKDYSPKIQSDSISDSIVSVEDKLTNQIVSDVPAISQEVEVATTNIRINLPSEKANDDGRLPVKADKQCTGNDGSVIQPDIPATTVPKEKKKKSDETKKKRKKRPKGSKGKAGKEAPVKSSPNENSTVVLEVKDVPDIADEPEVLLEPLNKSEMVQPIEETIVRKETQKPVQQAPVEKVQSIKETIVMKEAPKPVRQAQVEKVPSIDETIVTKEAPPPVQQAPVEKVQSIDETIVIKEAPPPVQQAPVKKVLSIDETIFLKEAPKPVQQAPVERFHHIEKKDISTKRETRLESMIEKEKPLRNLSLEHPIIPAQRERGLPSPNTEAEFQPMKSSTSPVDVQTSLKSKVKPKSQERKPRLEPSMAPPMVDKSLQNRPPLPNQKMSEDRTIEHKVKPPRPSPRPSPESMLTQVPQPGPAPVHPMKSLENRVKSTGDIADYMNRGDMGYNQPQRSQPQQNHHPSMHRGQKDLNRQKARSVADLIGAADLGPQHMLHEMDPIELPSWSMKRSRSSLSLSFRRAKSKSPKSEKKEPERHTWAVPYDWEQHQSCETLNRDSTAMNPATRRQGSGIVVTSSASDLLNEANRTRAVSGPPRVQSQPALHGETRRYSMPRPTRRDSNPVILPQQPSSQSEPTTPPIPQAPTVQQRPTLVKKRQPPPKEIALPRPRPSGGRGNGSLHQANDPRSANEQHSRVPQTVFDGGPNSLQLPFGRHQHDRNNSDSSEMTDSFHTGRSLSESDFFSDATLQSATSGVTIDSYHTTRSHAPSIGSRALSHTSQISERTLDSYHSVRSQTLSNSDFPDDATITSDISELTIDSFHTINSDSTPVASPSHQCSEAEFTMVSPMSNLTMDSIRNLSKFEDDDVTLTSGSCSPEPFNSEGTPNRRPLPADQLGRTEQQVARPVQRPLTWMSRPPSQPPPPPPSQQFRISQTVMVEENAPPVPPRKDLQEPPPLPRRPPNAAQVPSRPRVTFADDYDKNGELKVGAPLGSRVKEARTVPLPKTDPQWSPGIQSASAYPETEKEPASKGVKGKKKKKGTKKSKKTLLPYVGSNISTTEQATRDASYSPENSSPARRSLDREFQSEPMSGSTYVPGPVNSEIYSLHAQMFLQPNMDNKQLRGDPMLPTNGAKPHAYVQPYVHGQWPPGMNNNSNNGNFKDLGVNGNGLSLVEEPYMPRGNEVNANMTGVGSGSASRYPDTPSMYSHQPRQVLTDNTRGGNVPRMGTQSPSRSDSLRSRDGRPGEGNGSREVPVTTETTKSREETV